MIRSAARAAVIVITLLFLMAESEILDHAPPTEVSQANQ
jgi:hypothetical protein